MASHDKPINDLANVLPVAILAAPIQVVRWILNLRDARKTTFFQNYGHKERKVLYLHPPISLFSLIEIPLLTKMEPFPQAGWPVAGSGP